MSRALWTSHREAFALLGGLHSLQPSQLTGDLRKEAAVKSLRDKAKRSSRGEAPGRFGAESRLGDDKLQS